ncbi:MAG: glycerol acyltransferase [Daejeonella sp.]|nr:glycerol acyltransferase [Daejeonella sp.]
MYKPRRNILIYAFFAWYINRIIHSDFKKFSYNEVKFDPNKAILLLSNHFSWWDGFLMFQLNRLYFKKKFYIMITEENYKKVWFLKYLGSFSVKKGSKSVIQTLDFAGKLLDDPQNLLLIFPQGKLFSNHTNNIAFERGLMSVLSASNDNFQFLFSVVFADYFENRKPTITCYLRQWESERNSNLQAIQEAFNLHYETSRNNQISITV